LAQSTKENPLVTPEKDLSSAEFPCFEDALAELENIVHQLEEGQLGLAEALGRYEQGVKHLKHCYALLQEAEQKIQLLTGVKEDGTPITEPFDEAEQVPGESAGRKRGRRGKSPPPMSVAENEGESADIDD
jgi:exodeoxyribonuclease VII small subunit